MDWERFYKNYRQVDYVPGYEIVNKLGAGAFGEVYKIRKVSIGKFYAAKFLRVEDSTLKEAVLKELESVKLLAQIDHPNLVSIEDQGEIDGIPFIIMSYAGEETLRSMLNEKKLDPPGAADIFRQVCAGVQALHERSIIHFDLKPANVYLKGELARVGDYGLSKLISRSRRSLSFGRGTPYYMAPEMLKRRGDHRSDVYSLGVILYECLAGQVPFDGDSEWEVLKKHETAELTFPDSVQEPFRSAIAMAMAKNPDDRFQSVSAFRQAVSGSIPSTLGEWPAPAIGEVRDSAPTATSCETDRPSLARRAGVATRHGAGRLVAAPLRTARAVGASGVRTLRASASTLVQVPGRLLAWFLQLGVFAILVVIFFIVLHLLFKIPLIFLRFL